MATMQIVVHAKRPTGSIVAGETFALKQVPTLTVNDLKEGQILLKNLYLSLDPAMRGEYTLQLEAYSSFDSGCMLI